MHSDPSSKVERQALSPVAVNKASGRLEQSFLRLEKQVSLTNPSRGHEGFSFARGLLGVVQTLAESRSC